MVKKTKPGKTELDAAMKLIIQIPCYNEELILYGYTIEALIQGGGKLRAGLSAL